MKTQMMFGVALAGLVLVAGVVHAQERGNRPDFSTLDANGDGQLTRAEIEAHGVARFAERDGDGDGALSRDELLAGASLRMERRVNRMIEQRDENGDGILQEAELGPREGGRGARLFERADSNGDGQISQAEFEAMKGGRDGRRDRG